MKSAKEVKATEPKRKPGRPPKKKDEPIVSKKIEKFDPPDLSVPVNLAREALSMM